MDLSFDLILALDRKGIIFYANSAAADCLETSVEKLAGSSYSEWVLSKEADRIAQFYEEENAGLLIGFTDAPFLSRSGKERIINLSATPLKEDETIIGCVLMGRDVTERRFRERLLNELRQADHAITESLDLKETLRNIVKEAVESLGFDRAGIWLYDSENQTVKGTYGTDPAGNLTDESDYIVSIDYYPAPYHAVLRGEIPYFYTHDLSEEPALNEILRQMVSNIHALAIAPLKSEGEILGFISVDNMITDRGIDPEQIEALLSLGRQAAIAIANAKLYEETQYLTDKLKKRNELFSEVYRAHQMVSNSGGLTEIVRQVILQVRETLGFDRASVWLYHPDTHTLQGLLGTSRKGEITDETHLVLQLEEDDPEWSPLLQSDKGYFLIQDYEKRLPLSEKLTDMTGVRQHLTVPLRSGGRLLGLLFADNLITQRQIDEETVIPAIQIFAGLAATAILSSLEMKETERANHERERSLQLEAVLATIRRVNHEVNNPLQAMAMILDLMERDMARGQSIPQRRLAAMKESCERLKDLSFRLSQLVRPVFEETPGIGAMLDIEESRRKNGEIEKPRDPG
jgi:PAS domain S-box-containing protein